MNLRLRCSTLPAAILTAIVLLTATALPARAELRMGEKSFGPKIGYVSKNQSVLAGLAFQYTFSRHFRVVPDVGIIFRHKDLDGLEVNLNAHVPFGFENDKVALYPLAGVNYTSWGLHGSGKEEGNDVTSHDNRFGINAGGGVELRCTSTLKLSLEAKHCFLRNYNNTQISLGISYVF